MTDRTPKTPRPPRDNSANAQKARPGTGGDLRTRLAAAAQEVEADKPAAGRARSAAPRKAAPRTSRAAESDKPAAPRARATAPRAPRASDADKPAATRARSTAPLTSRAADADKPAVTRARTAAAPRARRVTESDQPAPSRDRTAARHTPSAPPAAWDDAPAYAAAPSSPPPPPPSSPTWTPASAQPPASPPAPPAAPSRASGPATPPPPPASARGRKGSSLMTIGLRIALGFIVVAVVGFIFRLASGTEDDRPINEAKVGECININDAGAEEVGTYERKACDKSHALEVIGNVSHPERKGAPYPGVDAVEAFAQTQCAAIFADYVGIPYEESTLLVAPLYPTSDTWDAGDRRSICVVQSGESPTLEAPVRGIRS